MKDASSGVGERFRVDLEGMGATTDGEACHRFSAFPCVSNPGRFNLRSSPARLSGSKGGDGQSTWSVERLERSVPEKGAATGAEPELRFAVWNEARAWLGNPDLVAG
jgi:hypothetical protein